MNGLTAEGWGDAAKDAEQGTDRARTMIGNPGVPAASGVLERKHALNSRFQLSYMRKRGSANRRETYGSALKDIGSFGSVEEFWSYYSHLVRPSDLPFHTECYLFRESVEPLWEDPANKNGGRWTVRLKKGIASRAFEDLALALIGEQFDDMEMVCGLALSIRFNEDVIAIWTRTAEDDDVLDAVRATAEACTEYLPPMTTKEWEFKQHDTSGAN